jgi:hypothetical protein
MVLRARTTRPHEGANEVAQLKAKLAKKDSVIVRPART